MTKKKTPSENIETDQDNLMSTLESIRALLEQNEGKLTAARESISIANTNTRNDTSALHNMRSGTYQEEIVPILDDIVEPDLSLESLDNIPELDSIFSLPEIETQLQTKNLDTPESSGSSSQKAKVLQDTSTNKPDLAILTAKNLLIDALDDLQLELEESLRETLMRTMVTLEKDLKDKISKKIETIKSKINK